MSISQGTRPVREYASQFETLLGRLDSYDESMLLNQFVWGLRPELAHSVSLHYPKSIAQAVYHGFHLSACTNEPFGEDLCARCEAVI